MLQALKLKGLTITAVILTFNLINVTESSEGVTWTFSKTIDKDEKKESTSGILWLYVTCIIKSHKPFIYVSSSISPFFKNVSMPVPFLHSLNV